MAIERFCDKIVEALREPWLSPEERRKQQDIVTQQRIAEEKQRAEEEQQQAEKARHAEEERRWAEAVRPREAGRRRAIALGSFGVVTFGIAVVVVTLWAWLPQRETVEVPSTYSARQEELSRIPGNRVFFTSWSSDLSGVSASSLEQQAKWLNAHAATKVTVRAYCDDQEERTNEAAAMVLGEARAKAVKNALVGFGVPGDLISTINSCQKPPAVQGATEEARAQNRRAVRTVN